MVTPVPGCADAVNRTKGRSPPTAGRGDVGNFVIPPGRWIAERIFELIDRRPPRGDDHRARASP